MATQGLRLRWIAALVLGLVTAQAHTADSVKQGDAFRGFLQAHQSGDYNNAKRMAQDYLASGGTDDAFRANVWLGMYWMGNVDAKMREKKNLVLAQKYLEAALSMKRDPFILAKLAQVLDDNPASDSERTLAAIKEAAEAGDVWATVVLAQSYEVGLRGLNFDPSAALAILDVWLSKSTPETKGYDVVLKTKARIEPKAARLNAAMAKVDFSQLERRGHDGDLTAIGDLIGVFGSGRYGHVVDKGREAFWIKAMSAHRSKDKSAYGALAEAYRDGIGTAKDWRKAIVYFDLAAAGGDRQYRLALADLQREHGDSAGANKVYEELCDRVAKPEPWACQQIALVHAEQNNWDAAVAYARKSGNQKMVAAAESGRYQALNRTGDFEFRAGTPERGHNYYAWHADCREGGSAFVIVSDSDKNTFRYTRLGGPGGGYGIGIGVEAAMRKACKGD